MSFTMNSGRQPHYVRLCFIHLFISLVVLSTSWGAREPLPEWPEPPAHSTYTKPPLVKGEPFIGIWNVPDACYKPTALGNTLLHNREHYFGFISKYGKVNDQEVKLFYKEHFGKFPYFAHHKEGEPKNGGIPHKGNYDGHIDQSRKGYKQFIPTDKAGLAILDFEQWRPLWVRNWGGKKLYRRLTKDYCDLDVNVTDKTVTCADKSKALETYYENEAWRYLLDPMLVGLNHSKKKLWGYYLFPDCYNTHYSNDRMDTWLKAPGCPNTEFMRNFGLARLWNHSTGLFPSVYLDYVLADNISGRYYTRHRIRESIKMSFAPKGPGPDGLGHLKDAKWPNNRNNYEWETGKPTRNLSIPIYVYVRNAFKDEEDLHLSELDLVNTIGESAAQGVSGFIAWGKMRFAMNKVTCTRARTFLDDVMLPYMLNVSTSAKLCSKALCSARGRCSRVRWQSETFLHLDARRYQIQKGGDGELTVEGELSKEDLNYFNQHFKCVCYNPPRADLHNCSLPTVPPKLKPPVIKPIDKHPTPRKKLAVGLAAGAGVATGVVAGSGLVYAFIIR